MRINPKLIAYEDEEIVVVTQNIGKAGGTAFFYIRKEDGLILPVDAGFGFDENRIQNEDRIAPQVSDDDREMIRILRDCTHRGQQIDWILTHGHLDHTFAADMLSREFNIRWHCTPTTQFMLERSRMRKERVATQPELNYNTLGESGQLSLAGFSVDYFPTVHSVPETISFSLSTERGFNGLHMAEFRTRESSLTPGLSKKMFDGISRGTLKNPYHVVFYDALRDEEGFSEPEDVVVEPILAYLNHLKAIKKYEKGTAIILPFISSKVWLIAVLQQLANQLRFRMYPVGRAMEETAQYGLTRKWIEEQIPWTTAECEGEFIPCTGSQNEPSSAYVRMVAGNARDFCLMPIDYFIMLQTIIPHYIDEVAQLTKEALRKLGGGAMTRTDAQRLGLKNDNKITIIDDLLGRHFDNTSGHGRKGDQDAVKAAAPCINDNYKGYQSEEDDPIPHESDDEPDEKKLETLRLKLLQIFKQVN